MKKQKRPHSTAVMLRTILCAEGRSSLANLWIFLDLSLHNSSVRCFDPLSSPLWSGIGVCPIFNELSNLFLPILVMHDCKKRNGVKLCGFSIWHFGFNICLGTAVRFVFLKVEDELPWRRMSSDARELS